MAYLEASEARSARSPIDDAGDAGGAYAAGVARECAALVGRMRPTTDATIAAETRRAYNGARAACDELHAAALAACRNR